MASRTSIAHLLMMGLDEYEDLWDQENNANLAALETLAAGYSTFSVSGGTLVLTADNRRFALLVFDGTLASDQIVQVDDTISRFYRITNTTTGNFTLTARAGAGGSTLQIAQGQTVAFITDGTGLSRIRYIAGAADVPFSPAGDIAAATVQAAIEELDSKKAASAHTHATGDITGLDDALSNHTHAISQVTGLQDELDALNAHDGLLAPGFVLPYAGTTAPAGWLECDGSAISRTSYADLFGVIGTSAGSGDGSTTFNIPDYRGEGIRGWDHGRGVDNGRAINSAQGGSIEAHTHSYSRGTVSTSGGSAYSSGMTQNPPFSFVSSVSSGTTGATTGTSGSTETRMRNLAAMFILKY